MKANLEDAESQISTLESDYTASQSKVNSLESQVSSAQSSYSNLKKKVDNGEPYAEFLEKWYFTLEYTEVDLVTAIQFMGAISDLDDAEVKEKWLAYLTKPTDENFAAFWIAIWDGLCEALYPGASF